MKRAKYGYSQERKEWLGVIYDGKTIVTIGCEATKSEIQDWCKRALAGDETDMYDRKTSQ
jgi:hypothetical protein